VHPTTKNQVYSKESTINSYAWYFQAIPSKFSCATFQKNLQNTSHFVTLFSAHGDVVVGFAIFHIVIFQKIKKRKIKEKRHSSMVCESWWHPMESVSHGL
jgi:heme/copper-type cytochrome/quinol oxidase subunit 3